MLLKEGTIPIFHHNFKFQVITAIPLTASPSLKQGTVKILQDLECGIASCQERSSSPAPRCHKHTEATVQCQGEVTHDFLKSQQLLGAKSQPITRQHSRSWKNSMKGLENNQFGKDEATS